MIDRRDKLDRLLSAKSVCALLDCSDRCLRRWMSNGKFPPPDGRIGRSLRWKVSTVQKFFELIGEERDETQKSTRPR